MKKLFLLTICLLFTNLLIAQDKDSVSVQQPETFKMEWNNSTIVMQKYFIVFLKKGPNRDQSKKEAAELQKQHLAYLDKLYKMGKTSITGPFGDDGEIRGIVIYNTATLQEAKKLATQGPAVQAGRLTVEIHPFWAAKGSVLK